MNFCYKYPRPAVAVDIVVFGFDGANLQNLLVRRAAETRQDVWALPGGFVRIDESIDAAASRELQEETGVEYRFLEQLYTFGEPNRDPRERVVSVSYYALMPLLKQKLVATQDAIEADWFPLGKLPRLAFDHSEIVSLARERLRNKVRYTPIGFELLPKKFSLGQLQQLYEAILGRELDKRNFRKKALALDVLEPLEEFQTSVSHRAARLHRFNRRRYKQLIRDGINFEI